ncbi:xylulokinase [Tessaracoccus massiliensis]|uniref:xylulokinase n=1 Tax=Tessaracoccus massiliensis TaxID=1522311 RepID=UPI000590605A|nr:FGGY-family carbohydrate kinase [Tessaracoccus massiliensis]
MNGRQEKMALGIELGSTRVKAILVDGESNIAASGSYEWRSQFHQGHWTYSMDDVWAAVQGAFSSMREDFARRSGSELVEVGALGVSAMMHGYLALDADGQLLTPFRTWQDTTTGEAAKLLSRQLGVNIPLRWSVAHLYQAVLDKETHVPQVRTLTTLAGYVHWRLSGERVLGIGDASGVFPIDVETGGYDASMLTKVDAMLSEHSVHWRLDQLLPEARLAGQSAGRLTAEGALLLAPQGDFRAGSLMVPPEGDAGTGMVATNTVRPGTANVSAGTSIFAMVVLDDALAGSYDELDLVTTPAGRPVVMVHCNNGAADLQDWVMMFGEVGRALGAEFDTDALFRTMYEESLEGAVDAGGLVALNFKVGEPIAGVDVGRPLFTRVPDARLRLADFMRAHLYGAFAALRMGFDVLRREHVTVTEMFAHGGLFRTPGVGQRYLSAALEVPVTVSDTAGEGGAWGMALLAAFGLSGAADLASWLDREVFDGQERTTLTPSTDDVAGFNTFMSRYREALVVEQSARHRSDVE